MAANSMDNKVKTLAAETGDRDIIRGTRKNLDNERVLTA